MGIGIKHVRPEHVGSEKIKNRDVGHSLIHLLICLFTHSLVCSSRSIIPFSALHALLACSIALIRSLAHSRTPNLVGKCLIKSPSIRLLRTTVQRTEAFTLGFRIANNQDVRTGPLAYPLWVCTITPSLPSLWKSE